MYLPKSSHALGMWLSVSRPFLAFFRGIIKEMGKKSQVTTNDNDIFRSGHEMDNSCFQETQAPETTLKP